MSHRCDVILFFFNQWCFEPRWTNSLPMIYLWFYWFNDIEWSEPKALQLKEKRRSGFLSNIIQTECFRLFAGVDTRLKFTIEPSLGKNGFQQVSCSSVSDRFQQETPVCRTLYICEWDIAQLTYLIVSLHALIFHYEGHASVVSVCW